MARGELILGGAFANPADGAVIVFGSDSPAVAEAFVWSDPYVQNGLLTAWRMRERGTDIGRDAAQPIEGIS